MSNFVHLVQAAMNDRGGCLICGIVPSEVSALLDENQRLRDALLVISDPAGICSEMGLRKLARAILDEVEAL
jgi:hypothetical protein